mmetsp:Transcript_82339/g.123582  ORF Transcript_82339/g.123582 Transcript_82339/m.123582 type:complete len:93 (-) Transcript_82339:11-289(-)
MSVIMVNLLGYALAPLLSSFVMQMTHNYVWGMRLILGWSVCSVVFLLAAWRHGENLAARAGGVGWRQGEGSGETEMTDWVPGQTRPDGLRMV